jgi:radical SAM protein with 4Fe4S-binding SPASM domain
MLMRRRPLLRAAVVGGTAYYAGKKVAQGRQQEAEQNAQIEPQEQRQFGRDKLDKLPQYCLECDVRFACHGGCPKDRFVSTPDGEPGLNYLCPGFKAFFHHIDVPMRRMYELLREDRAPSEIVAEYGRQRGRRPDPGRTLTMTLATNDERRP